MTCAVPDGIKIKFLSTGDIIEPEELDMRAERRNYATASCQIPAGDALEINRGKKEPVHILMGGNVSRRLYVPEDGIDFRTSFDERRYADIEFLDPKKVLSDGTFSKNYTKATLGDIVDDILSARNDPEDVITGVNFISREKAEEQELSAYSYFTATSLLGNDTIEVSGLVAETSFFVNGIIDSLPLLQGTSTTLSYDDVTPLEAIEKLMEKEQLRWWVDKNGVVQIGLDGTYGKIVGTAAGSSDIAVKEYNITTAGRIVDEVVVNGKYFESEADQNNYQGLVSSVEGSTSDEVTSGTKLSNMYPISRASTSEWDGATKVVSQRINTNNIKRLEKVAKRALFREAGGDVTGSMVLNGAASSDKRAVAVVDVGDRLIVDDEIGERCYGGQVETGLFFVESVHHRVSARTGWEIDVEVSRVPSPMLMSAETVIYNPTEDKVYELEDIDFN